MGRKLAGKVHVTPPAGSEEEALGRIAIYEAGTPESEIEPWARKRITNPAAWEDDEDVAEAEAFSAPPKTGKGSTKEAWTEYMKKLEPEVEPEPTDTKEDIISFLESRGHNVG